MGYLLITCPETAHLELIEYQVHPLGLLVDACSRFRPAASVDCPRTCAARLDRRDQGPPRCRRGDTSVEVPARLYALRAASRDPDPDPE